jgi:hypothetical protein
MRTLIDILNDSKKYAQAHLKYDTEFWGDRCKVSSIDYDRSLDNVNRPCVLITADVYNPPPQPPWASGDTYETVTTLYPPYGWWSPIVVECTCKDWIYRKEVALALKGSAVVKSSDGSEPNITNPNRIAAACKHVLCVLKRVIQDKNIKALVKGIELELKKDPRMARRMPSKGKRESIEDLITSVMLENEFCNTIEKWLSLT